MKIMMKHAISIIIILVSMLVNAQGDIKKKRVLSDKVFFGAGLGLQFGNVTAVEVSPMVGYIPIDNMYVGLKGTYEYYKDNISENATSIYGGSIFCSYAIYESVLAYAEYEALSLQSLYFDPYRVHGTSDRFWLHSPLIGGGYMQSLGGRSKAMLLLLWNLNETYGSYYSNPIVRISFLF
jgi:hypothetical protein